MRGESSFFQRLLQFAVLAALGCLLFFASAQAQTGPAVEQRFLAALHAGDRATLLQLLAEDVRTTAAGPEGAPRVLEGRASALGYLDGWRAGAGRQLRFQTAVRAMEGARSTLFVTQAAAPKAPRPKVARLRIEIENGRIALIDGAALFKSSRIFDPHEHRSIDRRRRGRARSCPRPDPPESASSVRIVLRPWFSMGASLKPRLPENTLPCPDQRIMPA